MKKIYIFAAVLALLTLSLNAQMQAKKKVVAQPTATTEKVDIPLEGMKKVSKPAFNRANRAPSRATETATLSLFDTTSYVAQVLPVYGYWYDAAQHNQMIYPASLLTDMAGKKITSMTFFPTSYNNYSGINFYKGTVTFKLMEVNGTTGFAESNPSYITGTMTTVKTVSMPTSANTSATTWVIEFDQEYEYNGGDLVIDVTNTTGTFGRTYFYVGETKTLNVNYPGLLQYSSYDAQAIDYVPQVDFTYEYDAQPKHDLSIALSAPTTAGAGSTVTLTATVTNNGDYDENGYTVTFTANGNTINTQTGGALAQGASATFTTTYTTDANAGTVNFGASVACTDDAVATNNNATASTSLVVLPPPENVAATASDNSGTMTWDAPTIPSTQESYSWDFEQESQFNEWTLVSLDTDSYNWQYRTYVDGTSADVFEPHSGTGYIVSPSFVNNVGALNPDNWLISPEVSLGGTFTFWAKGTADGYFAENFGVFVYEGSYSGGATGFVQVDVDKTSTESWVQYTFDLSQYSGKGRIAIRHYNCTDMYWLEVDDIEYNVTASGPQPTSYNIYLEGQLMGNVDANTFTYTFNNLNDGTYNCAVSAVYDLGESAAVPTSFTIDTTNPTIEMTPATQTISDAAAGTVTVTGTDIDGNINVSAADNDWTVNPTSLTGTGGNVNVTYTGRALSASTTVTASATGATDATATVDYVADLYIVGDYGTGWNFNNGTQMSYNNGTYTTTLTVNANDYILFARLLGNDNPWNTRDVFGPDSNGNWGMQGDSYGGNIDLNDDDPIYFPEGGTYRITINPDGTFTITKMSGEQTAQPVITYSLSSDGQHVTITATGDGTVTLNVPGCDPVSGEGEVSITVPCGYASNTITVTATAQETGKDESDPATAQINIPAGSDWVEMTGTYNNPNDLLSFQVKIGNDTTDIMMIDQFLASTLKNDHPDHYTYTLRQTVNGETETSTPVTIPVYKTSSTMQGLYTLSQVTGDTDMKLKPNVVNTEMDFDVNPDRNVLYYNLYRSGMNEYYPTIDLQHRVSQLQKYDEMVGDNVQYFLKETYASGIAPHYDRVGNEIVERLDTNWVEAAYDDNLAYVPVIWTFGLYSARGDGKNNSYGSDIKREYMGKVDATITGQISQGDYGTWEDVNGTTYRAFHPTIVATGYLPQNDNNNAVNYNDGDVAHYVPYLCRAWCTNEGIHDYGRDADGQLTDLGELPTPFLVGEATFGDDMTATIGGDWTHGSVRDPWSFGLPASVTESQVTFKVRFYYKKVVTEGQQNGSNGKFIGGAAEEFFMAETEGDANDMIVGINEFMNGIVPVDVTYVNPQGMQSSRPFDGVNIVVTRYSDGSTRTTKIVR